MRVNGERRERVREILRLEVDWGRVDCGSAGLLCLKLRRPKDFGMEGWNGVSGEWSIVGGETGGWCGDGVNATADKSRLRRPRMRCGVSGEARGVRVDVDDILGADQTLGFQGISGAFRMCPAYLASIKR